MGFSGINSTIVTLAIANNGFWPELQMSDFQQRYRVPAEYHQDMVLTHIQLAMGEVNRALQSVQIDYELQGYVTLADAMTPTSYEMEQLHLNYIHAVYARAKAFLLREFASINRRDVAENEAKESVETFDHYLALSNHAVRDVIGTTNITAELL